MGLAILIVIMRFYIIITFIIIMIYAFRQMIFSLNRSVGEQKLYYLDIIDSELPQVSVIMPVSAADKDVARSLEMILKSDYPAHKYEIIPVMQSMNDDIRRTLDRFSLLHANVHPFSAVEGNNGEQISMNEIVRFSKGEIILMLGAGYLLPKGIIRNIAISFLDPEVGAVMGRVIPLNVSSGLAVRLQDLERAGVYQVDQQARYNLNLIPQHSKTLSGFRKDLILKLNGFRNGISREDAEFSLKLYLRGWKILYANRVECYEKVAESWTDRSHEVIDWVRGQARMFLRHSLPVLKSKFLTPLEKFDTITMSFVYFVPLMLLISIIFSLALFFLGKINLFYSFFIFSLISTYSFFGNSSPFFQIGTGSLLDGGVERIKLLPLFMFNLVYYMWYASQGALSAISDFLFKRKQQ